MVSKNVDSRMGEKVVKVTYFDAGGQKISTDILPPRKIYKNATTGDEFVVVTKNNRDYRAYIKDEDSQLGFKCHSAEVKIPGGTNRNTLIKTSVSLDPYMAEAIKKIAGAEGWTHAETIRCVISWGLDSVEKKYGLEEH